MRGKMETLSGRVPRNSNSITLVFTGSLTRHENGDGVKTAAQGFTVHSWDSQERSAITAHLMSLLRLSSGHEPN